MPGTYRKNSPRSQDDIRTAARARLAAAVVELAGCVEDWGPCKQTRKAERAVAKAWQQLELERSRVKVWPNLRWQIRHHRSEIARTTPKPYRNDYQVIEYFQPQSDAAKEAMAEELPELIEIQAARKVHRDRARASREAKCALLVDTDPMLLNQESTS
jgi:hypothetical protein